MFGVGGDDRSGDDSPDPTDGGRDSVDACVGNDAWSAKEHLELGTGLFDPTLSTDQLEIFVADNGVLKTATRPSPGDTAFGTLDAVDFGPHDLGMLSDPALNAQGTHMVFSAQGPAPGVYEITRDLGDKAWSAPMLVLPGPFNKGIDLSPTGLDLYVRTASPDSVLDYNRPMFGDPFKAPANLNIKADYPTITEGGLRLYHSDDKDIFTATRSSLSGPFDAAVPFGINGAQLDGLDIDASVGGGTLVLVRGTSAATRTVWILSRGCP